MSTTEPIQQADVGMNIRVALLRRGVVASVLGEHLGLSPAAISRRLSGEVDFRLGELQATAAFLETTVEQLLAPAAAQEASA